VLFYYAQTDSDKKQIFVATLSALLDELVCFTDDDNSYEITRRKFVYFLKLGFNLVPEWKTFTPGY